MNGTDALLRGKRILVVDDDTAIRQLIALELSRQGFAVVQAADAVAAQRIINSHPPDAVLIDWVLPGMSGVALSSFIKGDPGLSHIAVIIVTARAEEYDKVQGLDSGADDYVTKPFSMRELMARIKAVLRGASRTRPRAVIRVNGLMLDPESERVCVGETLVPLAPREYRLLHFLVTHPERVHTRAQLIARIWGSHTLIGERTVDVEISRLRHLLEEFACDRYIQTVHRAGYRFSTRTG